MSFLAKSAGVTATKVAIVALGLVSGVVAARWLGPEDRGRYALLLLVPSLTFIVGNLGVGLSATYHISSGKRPAREVLGHVIVLAAMLGGAAGLLFLAGFPLYADFFASLPRGLLIGFALLTPLLFAQNALLRVLAGLQRIALMNGVELCQAMLLAVFMATTLPLLGAGLTGAAVSFAAAMAGAVALGLYWSIREAGSPVLTLRGSGPMLRYGLAANFLLLTNFLNYRFDQFLVKHYLDDDALGQYSVAVGLAEKLWILPNSLAVALFPTAAARAPGDADRLAARVVRNSLMAMILASLALAAVGRPLIHLLYSDEYAAAVPAFIALLPGIALFPLFKLLAVSALGRGRPLWAGVASLAVFALNIGLNVIWLPRHGIIGASLASSVSYGAAGIGCALYFSRFSGIPLRLLLMPTADDLRDWRGLGRRLVARLR